MGVCLGCMSKSSAIPTDSPTTSRNKIKQNLASNIMCEMQQMHDRQVTKQENMIHDDPECKALMDRYLHLQRREVEAKSRHDADAYHEAEREMHDLMKNPKMISLILPGLKSSGSTFCSHGAFGMPIPFSHMNVKELGSHGSRSAACCS